MKIRYFLISHLRQMQWSALNFFPMFVSNFNSPLKDSRHNFLLLKLYIYCKKHRKENSEG